jgi:quinol monooxygenase YgiN
MYHVLIKQVIPDFDDWLAAFERGVPMRREAGAMSAVVFRNPGDPHEVLIYTTWDSEENAIRFAKTPQVTDFQEAIGSGIPLMLTESYVFEG